MVSGICISVYYYHACPTQSFKLLGTGGLKPIT